MASLLLLAIVLVMATVLIGMADRRRAVRVPLYIRRRTTRRR